MVLSIDIMLFTLSLLIAIFVIVSITKAIKEVSGEMQNFFKKLLISCTFLFLYILFQGISKIILQHGEIVYDLVGHILLVIALIFIYLTAKATYKFGKMFGFKRLK